MSANIKIGKDTLQGVNAVELENADALGSYVKFSLGVSGGYTVTLVANGSNFEVCSVVAGKSVAQPNTPTSEGQIFSGWYTDATGGTEVTFPYTPTQDTTLYARFVDLIIVGVTGLTNENGILTFTDDIAGVGAYTTSQEGNYVSVTNPLSNYFPFNQISEFTDAEGNVFVKYPQLWMKWELDTNGNINGYKFSNGNAGEGYFIPDAFLDPSVLLSDTYLPYFALGKYEMSGSRAKGFSKSGQTCLVDVTREAAGDAARAYGNAANLYKGYQQLDFAQYTLYNLMCMMFYGTPNIQKVYGGRTGQGTVASWSGASATGTCDGVTGMNGWNVSTDCVKMLGVENPYGNISKWCDGVSYGKKGFVNVLIDAERYPQNFIIAAGNYIGFNRPSSEGYIKYFKHGTTDLTRSYMYASEIGGSASTYCGDYTSFEATAHVLYVGGDWDDGSNAGLWRLCDGVDAISYSNPDIGARLSYRPIQI